MLCFVTVVNFFKRKIIYMRILYISKKNFKNPQNYRQKGSYFIKPIPAKFLEPCIQVNFLISHNLIFLNPF